MGVLKKNLFQGRLFNFFCGVTLNSLRNWGMAASKVFCVLTVQRRQWLLWLKFPSLLRYMDEWYVKLYALSGIWVSVDCFVRCLLVIWLDGGLIGPWVLGLRWGYT